MTERERLENQLRQAQKMEAIGTLAGGIAHDFNNVLTAVNGFAELTRRALPSGDPLRENQESILCAASRARDLVRQILTFSRRRDPALEPSDLRKIVEEAVKLLRATLPASIRIQMKCGDSPVRVLADATQVQQVLLNLGSNAADAMRERGGRLEIAVDIADVDAARAARVGLGAPGPFARLRVRDSGHGMDRATVRRIFDPFFTTKSIGRGTGLGLSAVHGIIAGHGGGLEVESSRGRGTRFELFFPLSDEAPSGAPAATATADARGVEHVLFVDDESVLTSLGQTSLAELGYRVTAESDSRRALALLRAQPKRFDAIVTDHAMPHMTGLDLAREARRIRPDFPVVLTSGYDEPLDGESIPEEVSTFLRKPYSTEQLGTAVRRAMEL